MCLVMKNSLNYLSKVLYPENPKAVTRQGKNNTKSVPKQKHTCIFFLDMVTARNGKEQLNKFRFQGKTEIPCCWEDEGCKARIRMSYFVLVGASSAFDAYPIWLQHLRQRSLVFLRNKLHDCLEK